MALPANLQEQNRGPKVSVSPDLRKTVERRYDIPNWQSAYKTAAEFLAQVQLDWGTADEQYPECRLVAQNVVGQTEDAFASPNKEPPYLVRVFDEISENDRTQVGRTDISYDQYGRKTVVEEYVQFSDGSTIYSDIVGTSPAPAPNADCILQKFEAPNDGTLIRWKLTYIDSGQMADNIEIRFSGSLLERELVYLNEVPPAPAGWTYIGTSIEYIEGLPLFRAKYVTAASGGTPSVGGSQISQDISYEQSPDQGTTGVTIYTIKWVTAPSVVVNPIPTPSGTQLIEVSYDNGEGFKTWTAKFAKGQGLVESTIDYRNKGLLVVYTKTSIGTAPTAPSPTIGGTVVLINNNTENGQRTHDGVVVIRLQWAEGNGTISSETQGESDGALVQTITTLSATATTPTSPGAGWYLINLDNRTQEGCYLNRAVYKQPPATVTYKKKINFTKPGIAAIGGSPIQLTLNPPVTMTLLADVEVSYDEAQITDVPFTVESYALYYQSMTPSDTHKQEAYTESIGNFLAQASGTSGTNSVFNGVLCDAWSYALISSVPSTFSADLKVLDVDNDPYLTATDGTVVFRRTKVSYDFS